MRQFIAEAKRRQVFRAAGLYAGVAFAILQLADIVLPSLGIDESIIPKLLLVIVIGFPLALVAAWFLDLSGSGLQVTPHPTDIERTTRSGPGFTDVLILLIALGVGYLYVDRFVSDTPESPTVINGHSVPAQVSETAQAVELEPSVAILPLENLSSSAENAYFAAGIHEDILNNLSKVNELIVTSRTSTLTYKDSTKSIPSIAQELGVNYVVEGSVRRVGERVRISVQLIQANNDRHLWSEAYDRDLVDVFEVQQQIASEVAHALKVKFDIDQVAGERPTTSLEAYDLFLKSRERVSTVEPELVPAAIAGFQEALKLDPDYVDALAGLAMAKLLAIDMGIQSRDLSEVIPAADKALALAPDSWMANFAKGASLGFSGLGLPSKALPFYQRAVELNPNSGFLLVTYAFELNNAGKAEQAVEFWSAAYRRDPFAANAIAGQAQVAMFRGERATAKQYANRASKLAPRSTYVNMLAGAVFFDLFDYAGATTQFTNILDIDPDHFYAHTWLAGVFRMLGDFETSEYWIERAGALSPDHPWYKGRRADLYNAAGDEVGFQKFVADWLRETPDNIGAQRYQAYALGNAARTAWEQENQRKFLELGSQSLKLSQKLLDAEVDAKGRRVISNLGSYLQLQAAYQARILKKDELAERLLRELIQANEALPPHSNWATNLQLTMAYAMLGELEKALEQANIVLDTEASAIWLLDVYSVFDDPFGAYHGLGQIVEFQAIVAKLRKKNQATLQQMREQVPQAFPGEI